MSPRSEVVIAFVGRFRLELLGALSLILVSVLLPAAGGSALRAGSIEIIGFVGLYLGLTLIFVGMLRKSQPHPELLGPLDGQVPKDPSLGIAGSRSSPQEFSMDHLAPEFLDRVELLLHRVATHSRFYQKFVDSSSQHWKDLSEIMEQCFVIQSLLQESGWTRRLAEQRASGNNQGQERWLSRATTRSLEMVSAVIKGQTLLGEPFETPGYTLNLSHQGACLLVPGHLLWSGQKVQILKPPRTCTPASVRWTAPAGLEGTAFAGVEFEHSSSSEA